MRKGSTVNRRRGSLWFLAALMLGAANAMAAAPVPAVPGTNELRAELAALLEPASRLPGTPANLRLEAKVAERFAASGLPHGEMKFDAPVFVPGETRIVIGDTAFPVLPMHPSLFRPGNFEQSAFDAELVYLGLGLAEDLGRFDGHDLRGRIAVMEFGSGRNWERFLRFGIEGFIFLGADTYTYQDALDKVHTSEGRVPRFFLPAAQRAALMAQFRDRVSVPVRVEAQPSRWERGTLRNLWALCPGSDVTLSNEVAVIVAPLDGNGAVPGLAQAAQSGANLHLLLRLFEEFRRMPPARSVLFAAVNARTQDYLGDRVLSWYLLSPESDLEQMRNEISADFRLQDLIAGKLETLRFEPQTRAEDEQFLINLRTMSDDSIGRQVSIKAPLVALSKRDVNDIKMRQLRLYRESNQLQQEIERLTPGGQGTGPVEGQAQLQGARKRIEAIAAERRELETRLQQHVNVLTLFNRVGLQTTLSGLDKDVAADQRPGPEERILRGYVGDVVRRNRRWAELNQRDLETSKCNASVREAVAGKRMPFVLSLEMVWDDPGIGFAARSVLGAKPWANLWGRHTTRIAADLPAVKAGSTTNLLADTLTNQGGLPEQYHVPGGSDAVLVYQLNQRTPAFSVNTTYSQHGRAFTPADTLDNLNLQAAAEVNAFVPEFLRALLADTLITATAELPLPPASPYRPWSTLVKAFKFDEFAAGVVPEIPVPNSVILLSAPTPSRSGFTGPDVMDVYMALTDERAVGTFYSIRERGPLSSSAFEFDRDFVTISHAVDAGETHQKTSSNVGVAPSRTLSMIACREFRIPERMDATRVATWSIYGSDYLALSAARNSEPRKYGISGARSTLSTKTMPALWGPVSLFLTPGDRVKVLTGDKRCAINARPDQPTGVGFARQDEMNPDFSRQALGDMTILNRHRLAGFRGISDEATEELMRRSDGLLAEADRRMAARDYRGYLRALYEGLGAQVKVYSRIASTSNDMLKAVVFYMALLLPFCFFIQRLLFKTTRIEYQMGLFAVLFVLCYIVFRNIHPAFRIASAPEAMFIAFVMGGLGLFVINILHGRFEGEMQLLFSTLTGYESSQVGYSMVSQQALLIGVNNMKRRRIRTALTTATIVLVSFTMLAFTSVSRRMSPTMVPRGVSAPYTGIFYHWPAGQTMDELTLRALQELYGDRAEMITRRWMLPLTKDGVTAPLRVETENGVALPIDGVLGVDPREDGFLSCMPLVVGEFFSAPDASEVVLASSLAQALGIGSDGVGNAQLRFRSLSLRVVGIVDDERLKAIEDLDGLSVLPIGKVMQQPGVSSDSTLALPEQESDKGGVVHVPSSALLIVPVETARRMGAGPYSVSIRFPNDTPIWPEVERLLTTTGAKCFVGSQTPFSMGGEGRRQNPAGAYYIGSGYSTRVGGLTMLIIPLLIASSIILNTMLGSVFERKREIAVFNAVGLNPTHIGLFFLAESFVYGIIGAVGGYLIGQLLSLLLNHYGWVKDINLNFSSLSVAYVIVFTISIVLLSTLYPAIVATKAAVPSGKRTWSMPSHDGRTMKVVFPFIYRPDLVVGVLFYLDDYLSRFSEASTGDLIAQRNTLCRGQDAAGRPAYRLGYHIALAPFDLGVTQQVDFEAVYNPAVEAYGLTMTITRVSGQDSNWVTTNQPFLERLRKFLLHWRNMSQAEHTLNARKGADLFAGEHHV